MIEPDLTLGQRLIRPRQHRRQLGGNPDPLLRHTSRQQALVCQPRPGRHPELELAHIRHIDPRQSMGLDRIQEPAQTLGLTHHIQQIGTRDERQILPRRLGELIGDLLQRDLVEHAYESKDRV